MDRMQVQKYNGNKNTSVFRIERYRDTRKYGQLAKRNDKLGRQRKKNRKIVVKNTNLFEALNIQIKQIQRQNDI